MSKILQGNCLEKIKELEDNSVDAIVTDPPYELGFMGKKWDNSGIAYNVDLWKECLRVLKPGGHLVSFGGTRTYHRMAVAIEDAGFEIRDMLEWIYASGFPKSQNIGKAYDKKMGREREHISTTIRTTHKNGTSYHWAGGKDTGICENTKGTSPYEGQGTATKPAHEPICLARKPLSEKTIVDNVLKHGTGGLDIDGCRIPINDKDEMLRLNNENHKSMGQTFGCGEKLSEDIYKKDMGLHDSRGRFPANILCTDDALNDGVITKSQRNQKGERPRSPAMVGDRDYSFPDGEERGFSDSGSKSRFFDIDVWAEKHGLIQVPKASKRERNEGCEELEAKSMETDAAGRNQAGFNSADRKPMLPRPNIHPTVKPVHLMAYLVRLIAPKEGMVVLDPFMGSGTTGVACKMTGREFIGIEMTEEYIPIAEARIKAAKKL